MMKRIIYKDKKVLDIFKINGRAFVTVSEEDAPYIYEAETLANRYFKTKIDDLDAIQGSLYKGQAYFAEIAGCEPLWIVHKYGSIL